jgi:hypothetical protein
MNPYEGLPWQELELALTENYAEQSDTHARIARETAHLETIARNRGFILEAMQLHPEPVELRIAP